MAATNSPQAQTWLTTVLKTQARIASEDPNEQERKVIAEEFSDWSEREFPRYWDWCLQDMAPDLVPLLTASTMPGIVQDATEKALDEVGAAGQELRTEFDRLVGQSQPVEPQRWLELYVLAGEARREVRLRNLLRQYPQWIFTKHYTLGGSHYAYTEGQSDAQDERHFSPGAALCRLDLEGPAESARSSRTARASSATPMCSGTGNTCCSPGRSPIARTTITCTRWRSPTAR